MDIEYTKAVFLNILFNTEQKNGLSLVFSKKF